MTTKITGLNNTSADSIGAGQRAAPVSGTAGRGAPGTPSGGSSGSEVQITDSAAQLDGLVQALRGQPAVDPARVQKLSTAIAQGTYSVDPQRVAGQLLGLEQALGSLGPRGKG